MQPDIIPHTFRVYQYDEDDDTYELAADMIGAINAKMMRKPAYEVVETPVARQKDLAAEVLDCWDNK